MLIQTFPQKISKMETKSVFSFYHGEVHVWKRLNTLPLRLRLPVYTAWTCGCSLVSSPWLFVPTYMKVGFASALLPFFLFSFLFFGSRGRHPNTTRSCEWPLYGPVVWSQSVDWTGPDSAGACLHLISSTQLALTNSPMHFGSFKL